MQSSGQLTLGQATFPRAGLLRDAGLVLGFSLVTALFARVAVTLPFTPVPITGQTLAVLLTGATLGSRRGVAAMLLYLGEGAAGLPVFAGGQSGLFWTLPSGGYLVGFVVAAYVVGLLAERGLDRKPWLLGVLLAGNLVIYLFGLAWLAFLIGHNWLGLYDAVPGPTGLHKTLVGGLYPFIPGDLVKICLASLAIPSAWAAVNHWRR